MNAYVSCLGSVLTFLCMYECVSVHMCVLINLLPLSLPYVFQVPGAWHWATSHMHALTSQYITPDTYKNMQNHSKSNNNTINNNNKNK